VYASQAKAAKTPGMDAAEKAISKSTSFTKTGDSLSAETAGAKLQKRILTGKFASVPCVVNKVHIGYVSENRVHKHILFTSCPSNSVSIIAENSLSIGNPKKLG
jgi:hypothetical protein